MVSNKAVPFFSIIIPTLNEKKYIPKLLGDLTRQQGRVPFEVIVVDGGSTDNTIDAVVKFSKKLFLTHFISPKKNVAFQRNFGAQKARGQYFIFFDADVRIPLAFLKKLRREVEKTKGLLFTTQLSSDKAPQRQIVLVEITNFIIQTFNKLGKPFAPGFNIIIENNLFNRLSGFDESLKLAEDHDLVQRVRKTGVLLIILKEPKLYPSFRRPEKIGYLTFLLQYIISGSYTLLGEPIKKELYQYPMGGHLYQKEKNLKKPMKSLFALLKKKMKTIAKNIELPL